MVREETMLQKKKQVGDLLVEAGIITSVTLDRALQRQKGTTKRLGTVLEEMGVITKEELLNALSRQLGLKTVRNLTNYSYSKELLSLVPEDIAVQKSVFPLMDQQGVLALAVADPFDYETFEYLAKKNNRKIIPVLATMTDITAALDKFYLGESGVKTTNKKILVIDDSQPIAAIMEVALQKEGFEVIVGHDGLLGLKLAMLHHPDLVICDSVMPRMDGYALLRALQANPETANTPVILLTSKAGGEDEQKALEAGFFDFIAKPVQPVRVVSRVRRAFSILERIKQGT